MKTHTPDRAGTPLTPAAPDPGRVGRAQPGDPLTDAPAESPLETLTHVVRAWDRFWFTPAEPTTLGLIRICCGIITLYVHIAYSFGLLAYVGADGWIDNNVANYVRHDVLITQPATNWD